jgi:hypothetical protein
LANEKIFPKRKKKKRPEEKIDKAGFSIPFQRDRKRNALY